MGLYITSDYVLFVEETRSIDYVNDYLHVPDKSLFIGFQIGKLNKTDYTKAMSLAGFIFNKIKALYPLNKEANTYGLPLLPFPYRQVKKHRFSKKDVLELGEYCYNYHRDTSFPDKSFEENCKNNLLQKIMSMGGMKLPVDFIPDCNNVDGIGHYNGKYKY